MGIAQRRQKSREEAKANPPIRGRKFYDTPQEKNSPYNPAIGSKMIQNYKRSQGEIVESLLTSEPEQKLSMIDPTRIEVKQIQSGVFEINIPSNTSIVLKITAQS